MKIKTTHFTSTEIPLRYHFASIRMATTNNNDKKKKKSSVNVGEDIVKRNLCVLLVEM